MTIAESRFMDSVPRSLLAIAKELRIANKLKVFELQQRFAVGRPDWKEVSDELGNIAKGEE